MLMVQIFTERIFFCFLFISRSLKIQLNNNTAMNPPFVSSDYLFIIDIDFFGLYKHDKTPMIKKNRNEDNR